jgi:transposase
MFQTTRALPLPPKSPELNPMENIWQFLRGKWLGMHDWA